MKKATIILAILLLAVPQGALAQRTLIGKVTNDETGQSMPGVSVVIKGTTTGVATGSDGSFSLTVPNDAIIVVSFVGFRTVEMTVENQTRFDISLQPDARTLGDVTVTARRAPPPEQVVVSLFGERDIKTLTTSIATISGAEIIKGGYNSTNYLESLNKIAGVNVRNTGGAGGNTIIEQFRGVKSWSAGSQPPLLVIDGVPIRIIRTASPGGWGSTPTLTDNTSEILATINPEDIESITVIRGQEGVIRYGTDASNGVVIINLKRR